MSNNIPIKKTFSTSHSDYKSLVTSIKEAIHSSRQRAFISANRALIDLYWKIGESILHLQKKHGWGKSIVEHLSSDLQKEFPDTTSFSTRNLWSMRQLVMEYQLSISTSGSKNLKQHVSDLVFLKQLVSEIPWGQNILIMQKCKPLNERMFYLNAVKEMGWSRAVLQNQIKAAAYDRSTTDKKSHNFEKALPVHLAEQADKAMKDVYLLDFLHIKRPVLEREIENRMVQKIKNVLLEFGHGFSFIGNQYKISMKRKDYYIDLLFFQRKLNCLIAVEIKAIGFEPEHAGKMNFYLNVLDDTVREPHENPPIGIILCAEKDKIEVEYALRSLTRPVGVAEYHLTKKLPKELKKALPSPKKIEKEFIRELEME